MMDEAIRIIEPRGALRDPVLIAAIHGGGALTPAAVAALFGRYEPQPIAEVDPDEFYDFTVARPFTRVVDGQRTLSWPEMRFLKVALDDRDLVVFAATEPNLHWRRLAAIVAEVAEGYGIRDVILLSAFGGATPHTRPIPTQWLAISAEAPPRFGREPRRPRYQGPATFSMALGAMLGDAGLTVGTLNAIAPFYLGVEPNPYAVRALARALEREFGLRFDLSEVEQHIAEVERQAAVQLEGSEHLRLFLQNLEHQYDEVQGAIEGDPTVEAQREKGVSSPPLPDPERIVADVEAMLREFRGGDSAGKSPSPTA